MMRIRRCLVAFIGVLLLGSAVFGEGKVLFVDLTRNFMDSMRLEALARVLIGQGYAVAAVTELPQSPPAKAPFDAVVLVPEKGKYIWFCALPVRGKLPPGEEGTFALIQGLVEKIFQGARELKGPQDDLWPLVLALEFRALGILRGG